MMFTPRHAAHKAAGCNVSQTPVPAKNHAQWHQHFNNKIEYVTKKQDKDNILMLNQHILLIK